MKNVILYGGSHDEYMRVVIKAIPKGIKLDYSLIESELLRRRPACSYDTPRVEADSYKIISGIENDFTTGADIIVELENSNKRKSDYEVIKTVFRPSHADYSWYLKYNEFIPSGGGPHSARTTALYVIAGAFAKMVLQEYNISYKTWVYAIGDIYAEEYSDFLSEKMKLLLKQLRSEGDSIGGKVRCIVSNMPAGLGDVYDKFHAGLAYNIMMIPAVRAFEIGRGTEAAQMRGSEHNDCYIIDEVTKKIKPQKNDAGGVLGGITTGEDLIFTVTFKAISSIAKEQKTVDVVGNRLKLSIAGRHDVCAALRAVVVVEAIAAITLLEAIQKNN